MLPQLTAYILISSCNTTPIMGLIEKNIYSDCDGTPSSGQIHTNNKIQVVTQPHNGIGLGLVWIT